MAGKRTHYKPGRTAQTPSEEGIVRIRGFVRGCLVDPDGTEHYGDWHENAITTKGVQMVMNNFVTYDSDALPGTRMGVGNHTGAIASTASAFNSTEYSPLTGTTSRRQSAAVSSAAYGTMSFTQAFASSDISNNVAINAVGIFGVSTIGSGSAYSIATFTESSKSSTQALNITYVWNFAT